MRFRRCICVFSAIHSISIAHIKQKIDLKKVYRRSMSQFSSFPADSTSTSNDDYQGDKNRNRVTGVCENGGNVIQRHCNDFLCENYAHSVVSMRYGLVMTNSDTMDASLAKRWWGICNYKICADGGANRLFDGLSSEASRFIPDMVKGDLDSLRDDVKQFYTAAGGCAVVYDRNQDHNDLDKCLQTLQQHWSIDKPTSSTTASATTASGSSPESQPHHKPTSSPGTTVIILGAFGGRFDQEIASVHALYKWRAVFDRVVLVGGGNVACLLSPGVHELYPVCGEGPGCALLPVGGAVGRITTRGLQWDLAGQRLELGGLISSSNSLVLMDDDVSAPASTSKPCTSTGSTTTTTSSGDNTDMGIDNTSLLGDKKMFKCVHVETSDPVLWLTTTTTS